MMKKISEVVGNFSMTGLRRMQAPGNIRSGFQTVGSRASIETDTQSTTINGSQETKSLPKVSVALVISEGKVLAVSRGSDVLNFNMPGGSVESGENSKDACVRELWEETGIKAHKLFPIYTAVSNNRLVTTYKVVSYSGHLKSSPEGIPDWVDPQVLLGSQFGDYFKSALKASNIFLPEIATETGL